MITYEKGDLFASGAEALVNAVNCHGNMGGGVARKFKEKWPEMNAEYERDCAEGRLEIGKGSVWENPEGDPRYILNAPTFDANHKITIEYVEEAVKWLRRETEARNIKSVAIPALGCGEGGQNWDDVQALYEKHLAGLDAEVLAFEPFKR